MELLPSTARGYSGRETVRVELGMTDSLDLKQIREHIRQSGGPVLKTVGRLKTYLQDTLSSSKAIWTLCFLMLPASPALKHEYCAEATHWTSETQLLEIEARVIDIYVGHTRSGLRKSQVLFKLTEDTIQTLLDYHEHVYLAEMVSKYGLTSSDRDKATTEYRQGLETFHFRPPIEVFNGMEFDGTGELLQGRSEDVKERLLEVLHRPTLHFSHPSITIRPALTNNCLEMDQSSQCQFHFQQHVVRTVSTSIIETSTDYIHPGVLPYSGLDSDLFSTAEPMMATVSPGIIPPNQAQKITADSLASNGSSRIQKASSLFQMFPLPSMIAKQRHSERLGLYTLPQHELATMQTSWVM
ncbi:hypothetical protein OPT61_g837 [Boeremia exigua]|uniref:Uncharacterized protein n=1 Tax=Boeremia exigua TaxID=749465 RepID=A0ACC2ISF1_9PLEO|nr:hypothetical protein OPT61_g837 [Boeremia exigua]